MLTLFSQALQSRFPWSCVKSDLLKGHWMNRTLRSFLCSAAFVAPLCWPGCLTWQGPTVSSEGGRPSSCRAEDTSQTHTGWWAESSALLWSSGRSSAAHGGCSGWVDRRSRWRRQDENKNCLLEKKNYSLCMPIMPLGQTDSDCCQCIICWYVWTDRNK